MTAQAKCYLVVSDEYGTVIPILDDGTGPMEYGCDVIYVRTRTKKRAKILALRAFRRLAQRHRRWPDYLSDGNPFRGMKAEEIDLCAPSGNEETGG